ncbi:hypothetical protein LZ31DRAFT_185435 [Colletotrichum somersetense]|nr:hypothetical protein LZ31DRAFT_185435 [Colletotrichum somersetense]
MLACQHSCIETMRCWTNKRHLTPIRIQTTAATMAPVSFRNVDSVPSKHSNHFHQDHRVPRFGRLSKQSFNSSHFLTPTIGRHNLVTSKPPPWIDDRHLPILEQKMLLLQHLFRMFLWLNRSAQHKSWVRCVPIIWSLMPHICGLSRPYLTRQAMDSWQGDGQGPNKRSLAHFRSYPLHSSQECRKDRLLLSLAAASRGMIPIE